MSFQISLCDQSKLLWIRPTESSLKEEEREGEILNSSSLLKIKSYEKILGELQNKRKQEKEN